MSSDSQLTNADAQTTQESRMGEGTDNRFNSKLR